MYAQRFYVENVSPSHMSRTYMGHNTGHHCASDVHVPNDA